jgi:hypothetical protein
VSGATGVVVDERQVQPGRGAYLHPSSACADLAVRRRAVGRALRDPGLEGGQLREVLGRIGPERRTA